MTYTALLKLPGIGLYRQRLLLEAGEIEVPPEHFGRHRIALMNRGLIEYVPMAGMLYMRLTRKARELINAPRYDNEAQ